ncbi:MAG TPA: hypothetical protein VKX28_08490 [Xanthobacteraceae bacterium]|nr:hypothetical protein [Xanthobacteraceae bacterium]
MTRRRSISLVFLSSFATIGFLQQASARGFAAGHGFVGHHFVGHVSHPIVAHGIRNPRRRAFGFRRPPFFGFPWLLGYDDQGPYYHYYGYPGISPDPNAPAAPAVDSGPMANQPAPILAYRPGCRTTTQTVPAESGGIRTIRITRCY